MTQDGAKMASRSGRWEKIKRRRAKSKNIRKTYVFEGFQGTGGSQVGPKMAPSWAKMGLGSELKPIFGHLRTKMAVKID